MNRLQVINHLIKVNNYRKFLNIGVFTGFTLDGVVCDYKVGVDPHPEHYRGNETIIHKTSDDFFNTLEPEEKFDIFFIDGMHLEDYVTRDINNCINHLENGGVIVLHDCAPTKYEHAQDEWLEPEWNGTVYKAVIKFNFTNNKYKLLTIDTDYGIGLITERLEPIILDDHNEQIHNAVSNWNYFDNNRKELLNLVTVDEFLQNN